MKKWRYIQSISVAFCLYTAAAFSHAAPPSSVAPPDWAAQLKATPIQIGVIGSIPNVHHRRVTFSTIDLASQSELLDAIWVRPGFLQTFDSLHGIGYLKKSLAAGKVIMFLEQDQPDHVLRSLGVSSDAMVPLENSNVRPIAVYLWQTAAGTIRQGIVGTTVDAGQDIEAEALLEQTVNHLHHQNQNVSPQERVQTLFRLAPTLAHADTLMTSPGWTLKWEVERNWITAQRNKLNEWVRIYTLDSSHDNNILYDYILMQIDHQLIPTPYTRWYSQMLRVTSSGGQSAQLYAYGPTSSPGTGTVGYTLSIGGSKGEISADASYSAEWNVSELEVIDNSDYSTEQYAVTYRYAGGAYARNTSRQYSAWIRRVPENTPTYITSTRRAEFYHWWYVDEYIQTSFADGPIRK